MASGVKAAEARKLREQVGQLQQQLRACGCSDDADLMRLQCEELDRELVGYEHRDDADTREHGLLGTQRHHHGAGQRPEDGGDVGP